MYEKIFQVQFNSIQVYFTFVQNFTGPKYWNVSVLANTGAFFGVPVYCLNLVYLHGLEQASSILKVTNTRTRIWFSIAQYTCSVSGS